MTTMKPLKCSICGYETNAVSDKKIEIICNGCYEADANQHSLDGIIKDGWLKDEILANNREFANLPKWMRVMTDKEITSYTDL